MGIGGEMELIRASQRLFKSARPNDLFEQHLVTPVPVKMAVEKLRGFVADHQARIIAVNGNQVRMEISDRPAGRIRRLTDRPAVLCLDVQMEEERGDRQRGGPDADEDQDHGQHARDPQSPPERGDGPRPAKFSSVSVHT